MNASDNDIDALLGCNYIDALLFLLSDPHHSPHHAALTSLVAERDELKEMHAHLGQSYTMLAKECDALKARVAELKAQPPADRELRERLVESALQGAGYATISHQPAAELLGRQAVWVVDGAIAEMRKGDSDE